MTRRKKVALTSIAIGAVGILICSILALFHFRREKALALLANQYEEGWDKPNTILVDMVAFGEASVLHLEELARRTGRIAPMDWLTRVPGADAERAYTRLILWLHMTEIIDSVIMDWEEIPWRDAYSGSLGEMTRRNPRIWRWILDAMAVEGIDPEGHGITDFAVEQLALLPPSPMRRELLLSWAKATRGKAIHPIWDMTGDCDLAATFLEADWVVPYKGDNPLLDDPRLGMATIADNEVFRAEVEVAPEFFLRLHTGSLTDADLHLIANWLRKSQHLYSTRRQLDDGGKEHGPPEVVFLPEEDVVKGQYPDHATP